MESTLLEIKLLKDEQVITESLTRIGIPNKTKQILYPSCYLFKKDEKYYICHFKQMFALVRDQAYNNLTDEDINRRNAIAFCLKNWGLVSVEDEKIQPHNVNVFVLPYKEKGNWEIFHKFNRNLLKDNVK
jgi:hypothetical protein